MTSRLDGSDSRELASGLFGNRMNDGPLGIAVDPLSSRVMWSGEGHAAIRSTDLDGRDLQIACSGDSSLWSASGPWGLAMHLRPGCASARAPQGLGSAAMGPPTGLGRVYWTSWGRIQCCELGTNKVTDVVRNLVDPTGLVLDVRRDRMFWTDRKAGKVQCAQLDGTRVCDVAVGLKSPMGLALGPTHLFWADRARGAIQSCCLKTGIIRHVIAGLRAPEGIAVLNGPRPKPPRATLPRESIDLLPAGSSAPRQRKAQPARPGESAPGHARNPRLAVRVSSTRRLAQHKPSTQEIMRRSASALSSMQDVTM